MKDELYRAAEKILHEGHGFKLSDLISDELKPSEINRGTTESQLRRAGYPVFMSEKGAKDWINLWIGLKKEVNILKKSPSGFPSLKNYFVVPKTDNLEFFKR